MMPTVRYVYWEDKGRFIGYLRDYPDFWTIGATVDDLLENLGEVFEEMHRLHVEPIDQFANE